jgi:branched-chain amino acid transport system permease protein
MRILGFVIALVLLAAAPWLLDPFELGILMKILIWGLFAMSFDLLFGYTGLLSLGHSVYFGLGAYGAALTILHLESGMAGPLLTGVIVGALAAAVIGLFAVRTGSHGIIITTAVTALIFYLLAQSRRSLTGGDDGLTLPPLSLELLGWPAGCADPGPAYLLILAIVALGFLLLYGLVRSPFGLALLCLRENEERAQALGYDVTLIKWLAFMISGAGAALAGSLYALTNCHVSTTLFHWLVSADALIWTLFGGAGTLVGPLLGTGVFFTLREALSGIWLAGYPILVGLALLLVARGFPQGLLGILGALIRLIGRKPAV